MIPLFLEKAKMPDDFRRPIERGNGDADALPVVVYEVRHAVGPVFVRNDPDMPEVAGRKLFENDDVSGLPFSEIFHVAGDEFEGERF